MRVTPIRSADRSRFTRDSRLAGTILRMVSLNSLAAFTQDVSRTAGVTGVQPHREAPGRTLAAAQAQAPQRMLEAVPPPPAAPLPRGSLLDLRV